MILTRSCHDFNTILPWFGKILPRCSVPWFQYDLAMISTRSCHQFKNMFCHDFDKILPWFQQDLAYDLGRILPRTWHIILTRACYMISTRSCHDSVYMAYTNLPVTFTLAKPSSLQKCNLFSFSSSNSKKSSVQIIVCNILSSSKQLVLFSIS